MDALIATEARSASRFGDHLGCYYRILGTSLCLLPGFSRHFSPESTAHNIMNGRAIARAAIAAIAPTKRILAQITIRPHIVTIPVAILTSIGAVVAVRSQSVVTAQYAVNTSNPMPETNITGRKSINSGWNAKTIRPTLEIMAAINPASCQSGEKEKTPRCAGIGYVSIVFCDFGEVSLTALLSLLCLCLLISCVSVAPVPVWKPAEARAGGLRLS